MGTAQSEVDNAQVLLLDSDEIVWSEAALLRFFNELQNDFALRTRCYIKETTQAIASAPDPPEYSLPSDCVDASKVDCASWGNYKLDRVTTQELDRFDYNWQSVTYSIASAYVTDRRAPKILRLYPRPTTNDTLSYRYVAVPADVALASTSALPPWTHYYLMFGVVSKASGAEGDLQDELKAQHFQQRYNEGIGLVSELLESIR